MLDQNPNGVLVFGWNGAISEDLIRLAMEREIPVKNVDIKRLKNEKKP